MLKFGDYRQIVASSNHRKRVNFSGEEKVAILRAHFVKGLLQRKKVETLEAKLVQKNDVIQP